jgi:hypothetical protein
MTCDSKIDLFTDKTRQNSIIMIKNIEAQQQYCCVMCVNITLQFTLNTSITSRVKIKMSTKNTHVTHQW